MSDSVYVVTGTLRLGKEKHVAGSIITLSVEDAAVFNEVIREASPEEIAVYDATKVVDEAPAPVKEPAAKTPVMTAAEKKAAAAAKKAEEEAAAAAKKAEEEAAAAAAAKNGEGEGNGESLV